ncbi:LysE family translocator [Pseudooceanicola nanhaiensis]|uniref:LysE family translocator n=1 Tax=Pseudooceanicola nanhaiensis TaxID=375761 RepID=UPI001CD4496D|nr:LysE family transporter [Pseudooceanicola nanhaiensis]MCA0921457.1 LysE family transporter [Pseudooceanicola nanhaiensis]
MSFDGWTVFALFWVLFVTSPGPNAVNCITNGMTLGLPKALWGVAGILTQSLLFLFLSAAGITALIAASPTGFLIAKYMGAGFLVWTGVRGWLRARKPADIGPVNAGSVYGRAFMIATINPKSVAGYLAAFSQFVQPDVPIWSQMAVIVPTALTITSLSYLTYTLLGVYIGRAALGVAFNTWFRRGLAACFVLYGVLLAGAAVPQRA